MGEGATPRGDSGSPQPSVERNIQKIVNLEEHALAQRSLAERISAFLMRYVATLRFVVAHLLAIAAWLALNLGYVPGARPFDPYPFSLLALLLSVETVFLAVFVLISQNRIMRHADHRAHIDLQLSLLAEQESTKTLQLVQAIAERLGLHEHAHDEQVQELSRDTEIEKLSTDIQDNLPKESAPS